MKGALHSSRIKIKLISKIMAARRHGPTPFEDAPPPVSSAASPPPAVRAAVSFHPPAAPHQQQQGGYSHQQQHPLVQEVKTAKELDKVLKESRGKLVVIDFTATWCGPCKVIGPQFRTALEGFAAAGVGVVGVEVNVDEAQELTKSFAIKAMPTFHFIMGGDVVHSVTGANKNALLNGMTVYASQQVTCSGCRRTVSKPHNPRKWSKANECAARNGCDSCAWPDESGKGIKCAKCTPLPPIPQA